MSTVEVTYEIQSLGQTNGKTYHVSFNCNKNAEKGALSPDSVTKLEETVLLLRAVIAMSQAEEAGHGTHP